MDTLQEGLVRQMQVKSIRDAKASGKAITGSQELLLRFQTQQDGQILPSI